MDSSRRSFLRGIVGAGLLAPAAVVLGPKRVYSFIWDNPLKRGWVQRFAVTSATGGFVVPMEHYEDIIQVISHHGFLRREVTSFTPGQIDYVHRIRI